MDHGEKGTARAATAARIEAARYAGYRACPARLTSVPVKIIGRLRTTACGLEKLSIARIHEGASGSIKSLSLRTAFRRAKSNH
jgi:hypothetical protein